MRGWSWLRPEIVPLLTALFLVPALLAPIQGHHAWRQSDVAAVARNLAFESPDIFHPRIDLRDGKTGITAMEFPLYPAVVAVVMAVTRSDSDVAGKAVSLAMAGLCWFLLVRIMTQRWKLHPWAAHVACASVPIFPGYAVMFMPETTALMLAVLSTMLLERWWQEQKVGWLVGSSVSLALAALVRPYVIFWGAGILGAAVVALFSQRSRLLPLVLAGVGALLPFLLWYFVWCPHLIAEYGLNYFFMGNPLRENVAAMFSDVLWDDLRVAFTWYYLRDTYTAFALVGLGAAALLVWKSSMRWWDGALLFGIPAITLPGVFVVSGTHFQPHVYFLIGIAPALIFLLGFSLDVALKHAWPIFPLLALYVVMDSLNTIPARMGHVDKTLAYATAVVPEVEARVPRDALVVVENLGGSPWHLHPLRRRGWSERREKLEDRAFMSTAAQQGAAWVVWFDASQQRYQLTSMGDWLQRLQTPPP